MELFNTNARRQRVLTVLLLVIVAVQAATIIAAAQNLGVKPSFNKAVQGQTAEQPEGAFLNLVNWVGNVICPVGAALCVVMAVVSYTHGKGVARWAVAACGLLAISGLTRLIESFVTNGIGGVGQ